MFDCPVCHSANLSDARACRSCGAALSAGGSTPASGAAHALPKGAQLQNRAFEIEALLGQGGRGLTYRGRDVALQRTVAIKEFFPPGSGRSDARVTAPPTMGETEFTTTRENFGHEASVLARFGDESIVRVFRVFEENNSIYLVMEFLEGRTLAQKLAIGAMPVDEAIKIGTRIAHALGLIHAAHMLHRAVAPANIFLTNDGRAVLIDFVSAPGISPTSSNTNAPLTTGYAAPELSENTRSPGPPADIYGLGATLYRALTGSAPAPPLERLTGKELPLPEKINAQVSPELSRVLLHALQLSPEKRFQSAREMADALKAAIAPGFSLASTALPHVGSTPSVRRTPPVPRTPAAPPPGASAATVALPPEPPPSSRAATVLLTPLSRLPVPVERPAVENTTPMETIGTASHPSAEPPIVPQSTPTLAPGTQFCPNCGRPMPAVMTRCPHCRKLKNKAANDPDYGTFREWHHNENTRIGLGWAMAIGFVLLILLSMWRGCESLGLKPERIPSQEYGFVHIGSIPTLPETLNIR